MKGSGLAAGVRVNWKRSGRKTSLDVGKPATARRSEERGARDVRSRENPRAKKKSDGLEPCEQRDRESEGDRPLA